MALERSSDNHEHVCPLPWPADPEIPEGHICECSRRWLYQPARWEPIYTLEELHLKQAAGAFLRSLVPTFGPDHQPGHNPTIGEIVPIR